MLFDGQNAYITASFLFTFLVFGVLIFWVYLDRSNIKRTMTELETRGITRSDQRLEPK